MVSLPRASRVAELIVDDLVRRGWPIDEAIGPEKELASRYRVGTNVIRQAIRILEARGVCRTRRGPSGGLIVSQTSRTDLVKALVRNLRWAGLDDSDVDEAMDLIQTYESKSAGRRPAGQPACDLQIGGAHSLAEDTLRQFKADDSLFHEFGSFTHQKDKQAIQIATSLLKEISWERCVAGYSLGSISDLSERFGADPRILSQAIRLIADLGVARVQRGRKGGLFLQDPGCATLVRFAHSQMASQHLDSKDAREFVWCLNSIHARKAAERGTESKSLLNAEKALMSAPKEQLRYFWIQLQQEIAYMAAVPALHMFVRCFSAFDIRTTAEIPPLCGLCDREAANIRTASRETVRAILHRDPDAAVRAQILCHELIDDYASRHAAIPRSLH